MPEYRRKRVEGGTYFITVVTYERARIFDSTESVQLLREVVKHVRGERPFELLGAVVLPDHLHWLIKLPDGDTDYSSRIGRIKALFTKQWNSGSTDTPSSTSRQRHRECAVWQRRFWEHTIRDERDFESHMGYIHYNPVRHGLVGCPHAWPWSSFQNWVSKGYYDLDWCCSCDGRVVRIPSRVRCIRVAGE